MLTSTHWGTYRANFAGGKLVGLDPVPWDPNPSPIGQSILEGIRAPCRVLRPAVREGFLKRRSASRELRGTEPFVEVSWEQATRLVADELQRVRQLHGNSAIFGGSYGWSSAGRFHHAQSQIHRFLNSIGGYSFLKDNYSNAAAIRVLPHVVGRMDVLRDNQTTWRSLLEHCDLFVAFGGLPVRNTQVHSGGANSHEAPDAVRALSTRGVQFVNISPVRHDLDIVPNAAWMPIRPGSDTALILALCHVLITEGRFDRSFVDRYTVGFDRFAAYVEGHTDGQPKSCEWAAGLTDLDASEIRELAIRMSSKRTMINMAWALQRAVQGEQPFWALVALASLLGQIGTPGGGFGVGYSCMNDIGAGRSLFSGPRLPQGENPVRSFIPAARFGDMLRNPGASFSFDGADYIYPDIRMVYWAGGNAFHHHQDINRLIDAWRKPETIVVHEQFWTAQAKFADIVLPATASVERVDIGSSSGDGFMIAMKQLARPPGQSRDDYATFAEIASHLGRENAFTERRAVMEWLRFLYEESRARATASEITLPDFDTFWDIGHIEYPRQRPSEAMLEDFRADPEVNRLSTPSGRIELYSEKVASFGYEECPGYPFWKSHEESLGSKRAETYPLHMLTNQPATRLHSQFDHGKVSKASKVSEREPITINSADAKDRGIGDGDVVKVFNDRGAMLAGAVLSDGIRRGVVQVATGAWYDPVERGAVASLDKHGNPNVLSLDAGTSRLAQGSVGQTTLVEIQKWQGEIPAITAFDPPRFAACEEETGETARGDRMDEVAAAQA
jgi:biotin/methionine sulfoxide reductase